MPQTLEERFASAQRRAKTTSKLQRAFNALREAKDNVSEAKRIVAQSGIRISARTWHKAITARQPFAPDTTNPVLYNALRYGI